MALRPGFANKYATPAATPAAIELRAAPFAGATHAAFAALAWHNTGMAEDKLRKSLARAAWCALNGHWVGAGHTSLAGAAITAAIATGASLGTLLLHAAPAAAPAAAGTKTGR